MSVNALLKPRSIEVETAEGNPYSATVTMEPFETGYAHTLGNALRRVLFELHGRFCSDRSPDCRRCS